jgi:hypothetical protein
MALAAGQAVALPITYSGSSTNPDGGATLNATVTFDVSGTNLMVTLTNTSTQDVTRPSDVLTAVFFDITPNMALTRDSAVVAPGSTVLFGGTDPGGVVGGEWAYKDSLSGAPANAALGISSVGVDIFGPGDLFPGNNLQGPTSPDGLQYGITSAGDDPTTGNAPVTGDHALIKNSVIFTLGGVPVSFDPSTQISNVVFQYGTDLSEPSFPGVPTGSQQPPGVPEPASFLLLGSGIVGFGILRWGRRRAKLDE